MVMGHRVRLRQDPEVFKPTLTTSFLTDQVDRTRLRGSTVLDLGCGAGPIAIGLALGGARHVHAVDLMKRACDLAAQNADLNGVSERVTVLTGDLFAPVSGMKFDLIVDDVSGVTDEVARFSSWFPWAVPTGGPDGISHTLRMLRDSVHFLKPSGYLLFPVLSLSRFRDVVESASRIYGSRLCKVASKLVPFNAELKGHIGALKRLQAAGMVDFVQIRSRFFWTLDVYRASLMP
jgi:methylase of polypeptide subunit release factors